MNSLQETPNKLRELLQKMMGKMSIQTDRLQSAPSQNNQAMMATAPIQSLQFQPYRAIDPMAMAQMLRRGGDSMPTGLPPMSGGANNFGSLNSNPAPFNVGLNPRLNRPAYIDFLNSTSGG